MEEKSIAKTPKEIGAEKNPIASKYMSDCDGIPEKIEDLGVKVDYGGTIWDNIQPYQRRVWNNGFLLINAKYQGPKNFWQLKECILFLWFQWMDLITRYSIATIRG